MRGRPRKHDYAEVLRLLAEGKHHREIYRMTGVSKSQVSRIKRLSEGITAPEEDRIPLVPPADRLRIAQERKFQGWSREHREAFLRGVGGAQFMREIP